MHDFFSGPSVFSLRVYACWDFKQNTKATGEIGANISRNNGTKVNKLVGGPWRTLIQNDPC